MTAPADAPQHERKRGSGARMVYEMLRDEILTLALPPGQPIDEVQLAERFGMSRTPIREALLRLAGEGLVQTLPNRSAIVAPLDLLNLSAYFDAVTLMYRVTTRLAARNRKDEDLARIRALQADYVRAVEAEDPLGMIALNRDFHAAIAEAGRNPYYAALTMRLLDEGRRILRIYYQSFNDRLPREYADEHEAIIDAIAAQDVALCDRLARAHADQIVRQIQSFFSRDRRDDVSLDPA
ncbi:GntR family transcriptional regulator [Oceanicella actignis]|uniref:DNA-binding transcriptional regulator, GntR family n=1 Tax=Oceanicella actignis TaxID=1189325 RepID=A0A1M7T8D8_9RHOB|nr:GntR family transcriptional regulator [Oceanicella actignis]TYO89076.1 DNA-binding GntR family transcriptional regulator [Oceanicella actignis]SET49321.1 transcriptional regulator, GntR family [Oceanicella actignis]SHN66937.1 DNA-binding transcriptional regulator, GntR family [Oceanicella actignis]